MTDGDALLRAVLESPKDDTARLVYADWLQEHGRESQAEFVRLQIKMHGSLRSRRRADLRQRQSALFYDDVADLILAERWCDGVRATVAEFHQCDLRTVGLLRRGLIEVMKCSDAEWEPHVRAALQLHPLQDIRFPELQFRVEIDPPGVDHGWQLYFFERSTDDEVARSVGIESRAEMIDRLLQDTRDLAAEFV